MSLYVLRSDINMTSVDSGVETGNDSNDSSIVQQESQHATVVATATAGHVTVDSVVMDTCESIDNYNNRLHSPNFMAGFIPAHQQIFMTNYNFHDKAQLESPVEFSQPDRGLIHLNRVNNDLYN